MLLTEPVLTADDATATALLNCLVREVCAPEQQVWPDGVHPGGAHLVVRLPRAGVVLRMGLARPPAAPPTASCRRTRSAGGRMGTGALGQAGEPGRR